MYKRSLTYLKLFSLPLILVVGLPAQALSLQPASPKCKGFHVETYNTDDKKREGFPGDRVGGGTRHNNLKREILAHSS